MKNYKIAVAGTGYVGLSIATLLSQHHQVTAVDIVPEKVELINNRKSPIQDDYIEKYLAEKELNLTATLDAKTAYCSKLKTTFGWKPHWNLDTAIEMVVEWSKCWVEGGDIRACILENEKYVGDLLIQKTYTKDVLNHRPVENNGELPRYYILNHHEAIISREDWIEVQKKIYSRARKRKEFNMVQRFILEESRMLS